jgi:HlyD family secretion protein
VQPQEAQLSDFVQEQGVQEQGVQEQEPGETTRQMQPVAGLGSSNAGAQSDVTGVLSETSENLEGTESAEFGRLMQERKARKKKRLIRRIIIAVVIAALVLGFIVYNALRPAAGSGASAAPTAAVEQGLFIDQVNSTGSIEPISSTVVAPEVDGTIGEVKVQEGANVNAGDVLFTINNDKLDQDVNQADLALRAAQSSLNGAQAQVKQINTSIANARRQGGTQGDAAASAAGEQLPAAQSGVDSAQIAVQQAQATYDQAAAQLGKRTATAPVAGTILTMSAVPGTAVSAAGTAAASGSGKPLCQISDLSRMKVNVNVNELDITKIAKDQAAKVTFSAVPGLTLDATVDTIASTTSASQGDSANLAAGAGSQGSGSTGYAVRLVIPSPDPRLKPGMTANVKITTKRIDNTLMVPISAITDDGKGESYVMLETNADTHESKRVNVKVKDKNSTKAAVDGNLKKGDKVVASGSANSAEGSSGTDGSATVGSASEAPLEKVR